jgi:hypothetical protein
MTTSEQIGELAAALAKAQAEMEGASKTALNPHFKNRYPDLASVRDACIPALTKHGIAVIQSPEVVNEIVSVETMLIHTSGQWIRGTVTCAAQNAGPQPIGSAITYLRRYSLMAFSGVAPDDDGEAAHGRPQAAQPVAKASAPSGYDEWLKKLEGVADGGSEKLRAAWKISAEDYRDHLTKTDNGRLEALKAQSAMADVKLKLVAK